jgi:hypothetical protein
VATIDRAVLLCYSIGEMLKARTGFSANRHASRCLGLQLLTMAFALAILAQSCSLDHGLGPSVQGISGTVRFIGAWPDSILEIRVAVFENYPIESFLDLSGYSDPLPAGSDSAVYHVDLAPGTYDFVAVAGRTTDTWNTGSVLGFYHTEGDPETPESIHLGSGEHIGGIDITVAFDSAGGGAEAGTGADAPKSGGPAWGVE